MNGYIAFILFSEAGLACTSGASLFSNITHPSFISFLVIRFIGSTTYMLVRLFAGDRGRSRAWIRYTIHGYLYEDAVLVDLVTLMFYCVVF
jgi:hypothetical protein